MREYLSTGNLVRAAALGALATVMALPRLVQAGPNGGLRAVACLASMILVAGAVTAWDRKAGLAGNYPGRARTLIGLAVAAVVALVLSPLQRWAIQPLFEEAVRASADANWVRLQLPDTPGAWAALALWSAGFQTLFCVAAPTCLAARLTRRVWPALILTTFLGAYLASRQMDLYGMGSGRDLFVAASAAKGLVGCLVYAHFGLAPGAAIAAGFHLHTLWAVL